MKAHSSEPCITIRRDNYYSTIHHSDGRIIIINNVTIIDI